MAGSSVLLVIRPMPALLTSTVVSSHSVAAALIEAGLVTSLAKNGGGALINVLSDASWYARPFLAAYSASKSAVWSFTNALRIALRAQKTLVIGLHVSFMDTDMTKGYQMKKIPPRQVAEAALTGIEADEGRGADRRFHQRIKAE